MFYSANSPPKIVTLVMLTALSIVSLTMFLPSLSNMAADFQVDYSLMNLSVSGYLAITAVLQLIIGPLSDRYGRRPVLLVGLVLFCLASLGCALATNIWVFLGLRIVQAAIISGSVLSRAIIRDMVPAQKAASLMAYVSMAMAVAPMFGPMFGGLLDEYLGWRANFYAFSVMGAALFVLCWIDLGETNKNPAETFTRQFRAYPELIQSSQFWGYALCIAFSTAAFYVFLSGAPLVALQVLELSPATLGICIGSITGGFFLGSFLSGRYSKRFALTTMMIAGRFVACSGLLAGLVLFLAGIVNPVVLFGATIFVGLGNGISMPSSNAGALSVRPALAGSASGLSGALTVGAGAVMTSVTGLVLNEQNGIPGLLGLMLACSAAGLVAALLVLRANQRERVASPATGN